MSDFKIETHRIGPGYPVYIVAEMSANHAGDFDRAVQIIQEAKKAGANAVKIQTYTADTLTIKSDSPLFKVGPGSLWGGRELYDLYSEAHTPWEWQPKLKGIANSLGLDFFSSPFDISAVEFLEKIGNPAYKISSFELVDLPLICAVAATRKPVIFSTGMATEDEIAEALSTFKNAGGQQSLLLKCTSAYPSPPEEINLLSIPRFAEIFRLPVGLSDHTLGISVAVAAVALGACMIEKHFTLSRSVPGPDSSFSLEPPEFKEMVEAIRTTETALGDALFKIGSNELRNRSLRRSLFFVKDVKRGEIVTKENVRSIRPGDGLSPKYFSKVIGCQAVRDIERGTPVAWSLLKGGAPFE